MPEVTLEVIAERLTNLIEENAKEHQAILVQTTKTNGKVAAVSKWQERIIGAVAILSAVVLPVAIAVFSQFLLKALKLV